MDYEKAKEWYGGMRFPGVGGEVILNELDFKEYWEECEANKGRELSIKEAMEELVKDLQSFIDDPYATWENE